MNGDELTQVADYLLTNGFQLCSLELLAECRQKSIEPPVALAAHFANAAQFEHCDKSANQGPPDDEARSVGGSDDVDDDVDQLDVDQLSGSAGLDIVNSPSQQHRESRALLRYQLRDARDEIERLKHQNQPTTLNQEHQTRVSIDNLDAAILDYLERKGHQYTAATMADEIELGEVCGVKLEDMLIGKNEDDNDEMDELRKHVEQLQRELQEANIKLTNTTNELNAAKLEIDRFSASLVNNILEGVQPDAIVTYQPEKLDEASDSNNGHFVSDKLFNMINVENGLTLGEEEKIASNLVELLETIEITIEPLLSGILLKHRPHLIPLLLSSSLQSTDDKSKEIFLRNLFNLIKRPDDEQRSRIASGCALYGRLGGDERCEGELLPQLWLQIEHKHVERRLLVAETAGALALTAGRQLRPILISICQQLMTDRESDVRDSAARSLSLLICFCDDTDKLTTLIDSSCDVLIDERIPIDNGLALIALLANIAFKLNSEALLVHKILKTLEVEYDNKRLIRAVMELIPHFYINLVLSLDDDGNDELSDIIEVEHVSKWNQIASILDDGRFVEYRRKLTRFSNIDNWEAIGEGAFGERFDIINSLLTKQVIRRIIDCCAESPAMPDFCLSWFKLFRIFTQLFPINFIMHHVQPHVTFELGLFKALDEYNFNTLLLPCYTGALVGPLVAKSPECRQHFALAIREALIYFGTHHPASSIFELTTDMVMSRDWLDDEEIERIITATIIGVLWEGVTHDQLDVRLLTARALTCATRILSLEEISSQLFPPINSLVHDTAASVRAEMAKTIAALARRTEVVSDLEKRTQKLTLQLMVDADDAVVLAIVRSMVVIVIEHEGAFREDFFIPQLNMTINALSDASDGALIEAILDFYDALLSSCCVLTQSCLVMSLTPALQSLVTLSKTACHHRHIQAQSLLRQCQSKIVKKETPTPTENKLSSIASSIRNPFAKRK